jgi:hypothetical protein
MQGAEGDNSGDAVRGQTWHEPERFTRARLAGLPNTAPLAPDGIGRPGTPASTTEFGNHYHRRNSAITCDNSLDQIRSGHRHLAYWRANSWALGVAIWGSFATKTRATSQCEPVEVLNRQGLFDKTTDGARSSMISAVE